MPREKHNLYRENNAPQWLGLIVNEIVPIKVMWDYEEKKREKKERDTDEGDITRCQQ